MNEPTADKLDGYVDAYRPEFAYAFDNDLILNWYPHRVVEKAGIGSLLELGVGHGYSTRIFRNHFDRHVIIDGSPKIIEKFRLENPDLNSISSRVSLKISIPMNYSTSYAWASCLNMLTSRKFGPAVRSLPQARRQLVRYGAERREHASAYWLCRRPHGRSVRVGRGRSPARSSAAFFRCELDGVDRALRAGSGGLRGVVLQTLYDRDRFNSSDSPTPSCEE